MPRKDKVATPDTPGARLREARHKHGIALTVMAQNTGYSKGYLSLVENGKASLTPALVAAYEEVLDSILDSQIPSEEQGKIQTSIVLFESHELFLQAIKKQLQAENRFKINGATASIEEYQHFIRSFVPDIAVIFSSTPSLLENLSQITHEQSPRTKVLLVVGDLPEPAIARLLSKLKFRLLSMISNSCEWDEFIVVLDNLMQTNNYFDSRFVGYLGMPNDSISLTKREQDILQLMAKGMDNYEMSHRLNVTTETIKTYASKIYLKLNVRGRGEAIVYAIKNGLVDL